MRRRSPRSRRRSKRASIARPRFDPIPAAGRSSASIARNTTRAIRDLLGLDVDVDALLPPDTISHGFDNIADVQTMSPTVLEGYLRAAAKISRDAIGDPTPTPTSHDLPVPRTAAQLRHVEGAPIGTRGGTSLVHIFPADGEYRFRMMMHSIPTGQLYGSTTRGEQIEVSINGDAQGAASTSTRA